MDRIIVLREEHILETGHHDTPISQGSHHAELYDTCFRRQSLEYVEQAGKRPGHKGALQRGMC